MNFYNSNGFLEKRSVFALQSSDKVNEVIAKLPRAKPLKLWTTDFDLETPSTALEVENFKAIYVESEITKGIVNCPTKRYEIVQHENAIRPIIEALIQSGVTDFEFNAQETLSWANLNIFVGGSGFDGVKLGFRIGNSFDSSSAVTYGIEMTHKKTSIVLVGYRQICSNGMKIEVPLNQAEIIRPELRTRITTLLKERTKVLHTKSAESKIQAMRYVVEAVTLLREPAEAVMSKAKGWSIEDSKYFKELIKAHVGKRFASKVEREYLRNTEGNSLWELFNAMTYVASHDASLSVTARETLIDKASNMLTAEMFSAVA